MAPRVAWSDCRRHMVWPNQSAAMMKLLPFEFLQPAKGITGFLAPGGAAIGRRDALTFE